jgi:hypothetical protein
MNVVKGVDVLSNVTMEINCVFLHLSENPRLCDRSVVETVNAAEDNSRSTRSPTASSGGGKREQASSQHKGKESRIRLA